MSKRAVVVVDLQKTIFRAGSTNLSASVHAATMPALGFAHATITDTDAYTAQ
ncbi:MAG TPA: hypothetical protein GX700_06965 [Paracoccus sp.]|nr:hypothetical protein [Paracoccus sp. (in: a-proteobacteria)]